MEMLRSGVSIACILVALGAFSARAEQAPAYDVKAAFSQTDQNHDGTIEIDEYYDRLVDIFFLGDADKDGFLTEEEFVAVVVIKEDFTKVDKSGEGKLSRQEFVSARLPHFIAIDSDASGSLSIVEVEAALAGRAAK
jgi:Ca2+-binding EF-hand superfamily protein